MGWSHDGDELGDARMSGRASDQAVVEPEAPGSAENAPARSLQRAGTVPVIVAVALLAAVWLTGNQDAIVPSVVIGLTEHAPLVLAATGFALLYRLTGLINVAYAETVTLGGYFAMHLNTTYGLGFFEVLIPAGVLAGLLSVATYLLIFRPAKLRGVGSLELIIISFGLSIALRYGLQFVFGTPVRFFDVPPPDSVNIFGVGVASFRLVALFSVVLLAVGLYLFIQRSRYGLMVRALAGDEALAQVSGIRPFAVTVLIWFIAGLAGGMAGAFYGVGSSVSPWLGDRAFLMILLVVLVGGIWGLNGVMGIGIATGIALAFMTLTLGQVMYAQLALIVGFLVVLKVRGRRLTESTKV
jgi:branched-subunit amino acid ABC-type transport system permease component